MNADAHAGGDLFLDQPVSEQVQNLAFAGSQVRFVGSIAAGFDPCKAVENHPRDLGRHRSPTIHGLANCVCYLAHARRLEKIARSSQADRREGFESGSRR